METTRYLKPRRTDVMFNRLAGRLTRWGISLKGSRVLEVRGRTSGALRTTVVNLLDVDGVRYLVAPRGETQWVRNLRAVGTGTLRLGRTIERFHAVEVADADKPPLLRAYLRAWAWEVGRFFEGVTADSPDDVIVAAAPNFPVFRVDAAMAVALDQDDRLGAGVAP